MTGNTYQQEARRIAETVLEKPLPLGAEVHHADGNEANNDHSNLVICQSRAYHMLLHVRLRALIACGNANWRKCKFCKEYDDPSNLTIRSSKNYGDDIFHSECRKRYRRQLQRRWLRFSSKRKAQQRQI